MDKSGLQVRLSRLDNLEERSAELEQYPTPPDIAADVLNRMKLNDDLGRVVDLGCGNGVLAIGAGLLDAEVTGFDVDSGAVEVARENARELGVDAEFHEADVNEVDVESDVVVMNPPFGIQKRDANLDFLETAFRTAPVVYALLHSSEEKREETREFIDDFARDHEFQDRVLATYDFPLPRSFEFHGKRKKYIKVDLHRFEQVE